jgi:hypothetical protein
MHLIEPLRSVPWEVRVAENHPEPVCRRLGAEAIGVRPGIEREEVLCVAVFEILERLLLAAFCGADRHDGRGICDPVDGGARARQDAELEEAAVGVDLLDRSDPLLAPAARVGDVVDAGLAQVGVVAGDVSADALAHERQRPFRGRLAQQVLDQPLLLDLPEVEVGVQVVVARAVAREDPRLVRPEEP